MLRRKRLAVVAAVVAIIIAGVHVPAWADPDFDGGNAHCDASGCTADAESGGNTSGSPGSGGEGEASEGSQDAAAGVESACEETAPGTLVCEGVIPGGGDGGDGVDPVGVAYSARDSLVVPDPRIVTSPGGEVPVLVHVPVWLWIDEEAWQDQEATAEVPGGSVTVTAAPAHAEWDMGDGSTVTCGGPGTPYDPQKHNPAAASPTCGHTYTRASTTQPDGSYSLTVAITWNVTWESSDGDGGELDALVTSASTERSVIESHGLVTGVE